MSNSDLLFSADIIDSAIYENDVEALQADMGDVENISIRYNSAYVKFL